jgi:hypothetical protein
MGESPEKQALSILTESVAKTISRLNKTLQQKEVNTREINYMKKLLIELDAFNDEAMRSGLQFDARQIAKVKSGSSAKVKKPPLEKQRSDNHRELMRFHSEHLNGQAISDGGAQGAAIKWLLDNNYSVVVLKDCYEALLADGWRSNVSWTTVRKEIAGWVVRGRRNGAAVTATKQDRSLENANAVAAEFRNESVH